jgi:hypothetical protein
VFWHVYLKNQCELVFFQETQVDPRRHHWSQNFQILDFACFTSETSKITDFLNETVILPVSEVKQAKSKI